MTTGPSGFHFFDHGRQLALRGAHAPRGIARRGDARARRGRQLCRVGRRRFSTRRLFLEGSAAGRHRRLELRVHGGGGRQGQVRVLVVVVRPHRHQGTSTS